MRVVLNDPNHATHTFADGNYVKVTDSGVLIVFHAVDEVGEPITKHSLDVEPIRKRALGLFASGAWTAVIM